MELNPLKWRLRGEVPSRRRSASNIGGIVNEFTGLGGGLDRNVASYFRPTIMTRDMVDRFVTESWFLRDLVNIPVDDMFVLWREFEGDGAEQMREAETQYRVKTQLSQAIKAGRKYGTGLLLMITAGDDLDVELDADRVRPGDLRNLLVANRFDVAQVVYDTDIESPTFARPLLYRVYVHDYMQVEIHASRVLRFDGVPNDMRTSIYDRDWGLSVLIPALQASTQDAATAAALGHLVQETSTTTLKIAGLKDQVADFGLEDSGDSRPSIKEMITSFNRMKSVFGTNVIDADDEMQRIDVRWGQLASILDHVYKRMAAISGIPATRLMGQSPVGMNATGESDMVNWAMTVRAMQHSILPEPLQTLDTVLMRNAGIRGDPAEYNFTPLTETSDETRADTMGKIASALSTLTHAFIIDEDEAREVLSESGYFGDIDGPAPPQMDLEPPAAAQNGDG